ncbi:tyrosine-type recombinase/integrase [Streptomyces pini]|uniref:Site-specific recombinase XerD n=1 Tax=Streptomyces pini TaxID=1520580 RepID=A0A1I4C4R4_9ACTN|nr:site-specific integrase [Streptomyces pini]SFK75309.1 Site-specific recombinase XerD [Streptomyces pini]
MASIVKRPRKSGETTYQVKWRQDGAWQTEGFDDPDSAEKFRKLVEAHDGQWPHGWIKGEGFVEPDPVPGDMPLMTWARRYVDRLVEVDERTQEDYRRDVEQHLSLLKHTEVSGRVVDATVCNVTKDDVQDWVRAEVKGEPDPGDPEKWLRRPANPKSIRNRHGLLFCIMQAAVDAEPQLRTTNPCKGTRLPRLDDHIEEEMCFLEHEEYARIAAELRAIDPAAADLADWLVGTGMRWGEATALRVSDINLTRGTASVQRAWKKSPKGSASAFFLGPPKTRKARRLVALSPAQLDVVRRLMSGQKPEAFLFRTPGGKSWRHANFYNRKWRPAVDAAIDKGLPKRPRIHDLRHTHVSWLIAANIPLPAIQARVGHESISTTVDRYGHLVRGLDDEITAAIEGALGARVISPGLRAVSGGA